MRIVHIAVTTLILVLTASSLSASSAQSISSPRPKDIHKDDKRTKTQSAEIVSQPSSVVAPGSNNSQPQCPPGCPETKESSQHQRDWTAIFTAALCLFTLGMAVVIYLQLRATQLSERAWMIGNPEFNNFTRPPAANEIIVYPASYKNVGKSPARLLEAGVSLKTTDDLADLPERPTYVPQEIVQFNQLLLVPEDSFALTALPIQMTETQYFDMGAKRLFLYAHGFVKYKDVFGRKHETTFCHYYRVPDVTAPEVEGFSRALTAPRAYNKAT